MFWLIVNNGHIGPFTSKKAALDRYRAIFNNSIKKAALWQGTNLFPTEMVYVIL